MVTLSIVVILGMLAAPSLRSIFIKNGINNVGSQCTGNLMRARSEAVNRNVCSVMCLTSTTNTAVTSNGNGTAASGPSCAGTGTDCQAGWIVFFLESCPGGNVTKMAAGSRPARPEDYIAIQTPLSADYKLVAVGLSPATDFIFSAQGLPASQVTSEFDLLFQRADSSTTQQYGYNVCVDGMGRTRTVSRNIRC